MKGRVLRSKAMMLVSRLPLSLCFFFLLDFGHIGLEIMTIIFYFLQCTSFQLMMNFELCTSCVYVCCLCLCNDPYKWLYE